MFCLVLNSLTTAVFACDLDIGIKEPNTERDKLVFSLLKLSLSKTDYTPCFQYIPNHITRSREIRFIQSGAARILWASPGSAVEGDLRAVRIPVFKGMTGYRLLLVRHGDEERFKNIATLDDLREMRVGVGARWGDRLVYEAAGLPIQTASFNTLWQMLEMSRFDYMTLGIHEPWNSLKRHDESIVVEPRLLLTYEMAAYFYVGKEDQMLHKALSSGMDRALKDGSYDKMLFSSKLIREAVQNAGIKDRHVLHIPNPHVPADFPRQIKEYWAKVDALDSYVQSANRGITESNR